MNSLGKSSFIQIMKVSRNNILVSVGRTIGNSQANQVKKLSQGRHQVLLVHSFSPQLLPSTNFKHELYAFPQSAATYYSRCIGLTHWLIKRLRYFQKYWGLEILTTYKSMSVNDRKNWKMQNSSAEKNIEKSGLW